MTTGQDRLAGNISFIGVTTAQSAIMRVFPEWARHLDLGDVTITGHDLPLHARPQQYRDLVMSIRQHPGELGALVTTHKIDLFQACRDLFDHIDAYAMLCGEASCLSKRDGRFRARAQDPVSAGRALDEFLEPGYWDRTGAHALLLGAGGAGLAISLYLLAGRPAPDRPQRIRAVDRDPARLATMRAVHGQLNSGIPVDYLHGDDPRANDVLLAGLPPGSLVVNATGAGKDLPGSPVSDAGRFPDSGRVWELNYRGELGFLSQARRQQEAASLVVQDGWRYFIHGWTSAIEEVFGVEMKPALVDELAQIALRIRDEHAPGRPS